MNASTAKHQARLAEWKLLVADCRSSGKSVRAWCEERDIGYKTYYRWEREILQIASQTRKPVFAEPPAPVTEKTEPVIVATVCIGAASLDVYPGANTEIVSALCRALSHAE